MSKSLADRKDVDGNPVSLHQLVLLEPDWACDKIRALEAELSQCLTAHAELNDKVCKLEQAIQNTLDTGMDRYIRETIEGTKLDDFNDRCIAEKWNEIND